MTGMASLMEAARLFSAPCLTRQKTIRFVATDFEEHLNPGLEGARKYAQYIKTKAAAETFQIVAAIDYEQSGWNCSADNVCAPDAGGTSFDVFDCSGDNKMYKSTALGDAFQTMTGTLGSPLAVVRRCMAQNSDHYAMWEIGVPSIVSSEHLPLQNPHFDQNGGDTYDKIDVAYHLEIARLSVAFTAQLAGVGK
jgi:Zn-dependent M28 family amino/carboxypeptidase